jgi:hypothetical protein
MRKINTPYNIVKKRYIFEEELTMTREEMIKIIIKMYNETAEALEKADKEYNNDKKNAKKREVYRYVVAQEAVLNDLCYELEIDDLIDDGLDDEEA